MISLNDAQLKAVVAAASHVSQFLERIAAMLKLRGRFSDSDVADGAQLALTGLAHQPAA